MQTLSQPPNRVNSAISLFPNATATTPSQQITLKDYLAGVAYNRWETQITPLRDFVLDGDRGNYDIGKKALPAVSLSGSCTSRKGGLSLEERNFVHSGLLQADFDLKDNPQLAAPEAVTAMRSALLADPHVCAVFVGPSGEGLKAVVAIDPTRHKDSWFAAETHFRDVHGLTLDASTKDPLRLCFVSFDTLAEITDEVQELPLPNERALTKAVPALSIQGGFPPTTSDDISEMLSFIPPRPDYQTWLKIASAVWSVLPAMEGAQVLNAWSPEEKDGEYMGKHKHRLERVGIGSLIHIATENGFNAKAAFKRAQWAGKLSFAANADN